MKQKLTQLWLAETVRLNEQQAQKMDDQAANSKARLLKGTVEQRILLRAQWLGQAHGLLSLQQQCLKAAKFALLVLAIVALFVGAGLAFTALATNPVNIFWALLSLLGLHLVTFLFWLLSFALPISGDVHSALGRCWIWLTERFAKGAKQASLLPALLNVLAQRRATRWLIGAVVNGLWSLILLSALVLMMLLLSVKHYSFLWQTTLLTSTDFLHLTEFLGFLPSLLGFSLPDPSIVIQSGGAPLDASEIRQTWALWLVGVFMIYGLIPRLLSLIFCGLRWLIATRKLKLEMTLLEYQWLADSLAPSHDHVGVIDLEQAADLSQFQAAYLAQAKGKALVAIELPAAWSPNVSESIQFLGNIDDRAQRKQVIATLQTQPVQALLIVCDAKRSPDRGTSQLLRELMEKAQQTRVLLLNDSDYLPYWQDTLKALQLEDGDLAWLESNNE